MHKHIVNNEVYINKDDFEALKSSLSKDDLKQYISDLIRDYYVPLPYRQITLDDAINDFNELKQLNSNTLIEENQWFTRYDYDERWYKIPIIIKPSRIGNKSSDYFQQENRWLCDSINSPSPYRTWNEERFRLTLLNAIWGLKIEEITPKTLRSMISLRKYIASQFRPSTMKAVIDFFNAGSILDFSAGWGDRLNGFLASDANHYTGIDPNTLVYNTYFDQLNQFNTGKSVELINSPAEDVKLNRMYDLVFTSPPYFNIEKYTKEDNQSYKRYKKLDKWLEGFLFKTIEESWSHLNHGGHMIINISDVYSNHTVHNICDPMNDFISRLPNASYQGCMCYGMAKRPNSKTMKDKEGKFGEPMWIWKKN